jgi:hypothetical protein
MLMPGGISKSVEVVGLQLTKPKLSEALERKSKKTRADQKSTRGLVRPGHKTSPLIGPDLRAVNLSKEICTIAKL